MEERRKGTHKAVHRLAQVYADLVLAEKELDGIVVMENQAERKLRTRHFLRESISVIQHVVDTDLGLKLIERES